MITAWIEGLSPLIWQTINEIGVFVPRLLAAFAILLIGTAIARAIKGVLIRFLETFKVSSIVENTPIEHFLKNADLSHKIEFIVGTIAYWLVMLIVLQTSAAVLGLSPLTDLINRILNYIPNVISAILILFFGVLMAGVVESLVKGSIKTIDGKSARLLGKIASYLVVTVSALAAISELGIAKDFIVILFIGFVSTVSIGTGLALGLGGKNLVEKILGQWYSTTMDEISDKK
jgi:hypothetical protein